MGRGKITFADRFCGILKQAGHDREICRLIRQDNYPQPPQQPRKRSRLEKLLLCALLLVRSTSPSNLIAFFSPIDEVFLIDCYVLPWVMLLSVLLFVWTPAYWAALLLAILRIVDIIDYRLCVLLIDSEVEGWKSFSPTRSTIAFFFNLYEIITAYAILYLTIGHFANNNKALKTPVQALYFSVVTMATVGYGDFVPTDDFSRLLVVLQLATGLIFVLAIAPAVLSFIGNRLQAK